MNCLANDQQQVRLTENFANMEIRFFKKNDGVVVSPVNVMTSIVQQNWQIIEPLTEKTWGRV